jgi:hypothetical protein
MKNLNYVLVVFMLLLVSCNSSDNVDPNSEVTNAYYRPYNTNPNQSFKQGIYVNKSNGEQYKLLFHDYETASFEIEQTHSDTTKITIEGVVELCNKYTNYDVVPYGTYTVKATESRDKFNLDGMTVVLSENGGTFNGNPSKDLLYIMEYEHEGVTYLIEEAHLKNPREYYGLLFKEKGDSYNNTYVELIKQD